MNKDELQLILEEGEGIRNSLPLPIPQEAGYFLA